MDQEIHQNLLSIFTESPTHAPPRTYQAITYKSVLRECKLTVATRFMVIYSLVGSRGGLWLKAMFSITYILYVVHVIECCDLIACFETKMAFETPEILHAVIKDKNY